MTLFELIVFIGGLCIGIPIGMIIEHLINQRELRRNQSSTTGDE